MLFVRGKAIPHMMTMQFFIRSCKLTKTIPLHITINSEGEKGNRIFSGRVNERNQSCFLTRGRATIFDCFKYLRKTGFLILRRRCDFVSKYNFCVETNNIWNWQENPTINKQMTWPTCVYLIRIIVYMHENYKKKVCQTNVSHIWSVIQHWRVSPESPSLPIG